LQARVPENGLGYFRSVKRRVIQQSIFKTEQQAEFAAILHMQPQHLARPKGHVPKNGVCEARHAQVAVAEHAVHKGAVFVRCYGQRRFVAVKFPERLVADKGLGHRRVFREEKGNGGVQEGRSKVRFQRYGFFPTFYFPAY